VVPCSARKRSGGVSHRSGRSVVDVLPGVLADGLSVARQTVQRLAKLDESTFLPAWQRYAGSFYGAVGPRLGAAVAAGVPGVILSGGYGIALLSEPIGRYDRRFALTDWPNGLLEECLLAVARQAGTCRVVAFCAQTTTYASLLRRVHWSGSGIDAFLVSPVMGGRGGAQVLVPRASGESMKALIDGRLSSGWMSSDGVAVQTEQLS